MSAAPQEKVTVWDACWEGSPISRGHWRGRVELRLSEAEWPDGRRALWIGAALSLARLTLFRRRVAWSRVADFGMQLSIERVIRLHAVLARWLGIPVPESRVPPTRCGEGPADQV